MEQYRRWIDEYSAYSLTKLRAVAKQQGVKWEPALAEQALKPEVGRQIYAPPPRSGGLSAATKPRTVFQADLMDMSSYKDHPEAKYALELVDVFTRKAYVESMPDKSAATTKAAFSRLSAEARPQAGAIVTTDRGGEFANIEGMIHRTKDPASRNQIAVADRTMQTLKKLAVTRQASTGEGWPEALTKVTAGFNKRPQSTVYGAPNDVEKHEIAQFYIEQDNALKFQHNEDDTRYKVDQLKGQGAFREAISSGGRSFKPHYSSDVHNVTGFTRGRQYVESGDKQVLIGLTQAVPKGAAAPKVVLTSGPSNPQAKRKPPGPNPANPMNGSIPLRAGVPLQEGRPNRPASSSTATSLPAPMSPGAAPVSPGPPSNLYSNAHSNHLSNLFGGKGRVRSDAEQAAFLATAKAKKDALEQARIKKEADRKQKEREKDEAKAMAKADRESKKLLKSKKPK